MQLGSRSFLEAMVNAPWREALKHTPPERIVISSDCGWDAKA